MNCSIFIPVRLKSERLPKKAFKKIDGKPIIQLLVERLQKVKNIKNIVVCTTDDPSDDELVKFLEKNSMIAHIQLCKIVGKNILLNVEMMMLKKMWNLNGETMNRQRGL